MFDRKTFKEYYRKLMTSWTEQQLDDYADFMEKKYSTIKKGENVIHLDYFGELIDDHEISTIETLLSKSNLELSRYDKSGIMVASFEDFMLQVALFVGDKTTQDVLLGLGTSALWDTIKATTLYIWNTIRNRTLTKLSSKKITKEKVNFGIKMSFDKNTTFEFRIDTDFKEKIALKSLDKVLDFLKTVKPNNTNEHPDFVIYNIEKDTWEILDVHAEIRKQIIASKENKKLDTLNKNKANR